MGGRILSVALELLGFNRLCLVSLGHTWRHLDLIGLTWHHLVPFGTTWSHKVSQGFTRSHYQKPDPQPQLYWPNLITNFEIEMGSVSQLPNREALQPASSFQGLE